MQPILLPTSNLTHLNSRQIFSLYLKFSLIAVAAGISSGCALGDSKPEKSILSSSEKVIRRTSNQKVFSYPFESVWRAAQLALKYPIAINNMDNGTLETDWIKATDGFQNPEAEKEPSAGIKYKISMILVKGKIDGKESVRVTMTKKIERQRDFFSDPESLESDGLEEKIIFYRIEREIIVDEGLKKAAKLQSPQ